MPIRRRFCLVPAVWAAGCALSTPPPLLSAEPTSPGREAYFAALAAADYDALEPAIELLTREYLDGDDRSTAVLGFAHAWRLAESPRLEDPEARVIESADLAVRAFTEASEALPDDPRLVGFLGSFKQAQGSIHDRPELETEGWFDQKAAARAWPEWGRFTQAYGLVSKAPSHKRFDDGIDLLWANLDACVDDKVDRDAFDYRPLFDQVQSDDDPLNQRACGNTAVVPYNAQGFFVVFGDLLAKAGDTRAARGLYETALDLPGSETWPYAWLAQDRLESLSSLPDRFRQNPERGSTVDARDATVFSGPFSCTVCHAATAVEDLPDAAASQ